MIFWPQNIKETIKKSFKVLSLLHIYYKNKREKAGSCKKKRSVLLRTKRIQTCWSTAVILALGKITQEVNMWNQLELPTEFQESLAYMSNLCLKICFKENNKVYSLLYWRLQTFPQMFIIEDGHQFLFKKYLFLLMSMCACHMYLWEARRWYQMFWNWNYK